MAEMRARDIVLNADRPVLTCWRNYRRRAKCWRKKETEQIAQDGGDRAAIVTRACARFDATSTPGLQEVVVDRRDGPSAHDENFDE